MSAVKGALNCSCFMAHQKASALSLTVSMSPATCSSLYLWERACLDKFRTHQKWTSQHFSLFGGKATLPVFFLIFFLKCKHFKGLSKSLNSLHGYQITLKDWCFDDFSVNESKTYGFYFRPNTQGCKNQGQSSSKRGTRSFDFKCLKAVQDVQWNRPADRTHRSDYILLQDKDGFYRQDGILEILTCRDEIR